MADDFKFGNSLTPDMIAKINASIQPQRVFRLFLFIWLGVQFCAIVLLTFEQSGCSFLTILTVHFCAADGKLRNTWFGLEKPLDRRSISRAASSSRRARVTLEMLL